MNMKQIRSLKNQSHFFVIFFSFFTLCSFYNNKPDIFEATQTGDIKKIRSLVKTDADIIEVRDNQGNSLLHIVAQKGCTDRIKEIIGEFIGAGIKVEVRNKERQTPLHKAAWSGCIGAV